MVLCLFGLGGRDGGKGKQEEGGKEGYVQVAGGGFVEAHGAGEGLDLLVQDLQGLLSRRGRDGGREGGREGGRGARGK